MKTNSKKTLVEKFISKGWKLASEERPTIGMTVLTARILPSYFDGQFFVTYDIENVNDITNMVNHMCDINQAWEFGTSSVIILWKKITLPVDNHATADDSLVELTKKGGIK